MITKIEAVNFKCLKGVSQTLGNFHVVAGPNGSGKSTFFDVPRLLAAFGRDGLNGLFQAAGASTLEELLFLGKGRHFELALEMAIPDKIRALSGQNGRTPRVVRYEVRIGYGDGEDHKHQPRIIAENLWLVPEAKPVPRKERVQLEMEFPSASRDDFDVVHTTAPRGAGWKTVAKKTTVGNSYFKSEATEWNLQIRNKPEESALRSLPSDERFPLSNWFRQQLLEGAHHLALNSEAMRKPSPPLKKGGFRHDGSNLPHVVADLPDDLSGKKAWVEHLRTILPIKDIRVIEREEDKHKYLKVLYDNGADVPSWHLSDGTLRMLALTLLAYLPSNENVYFIEEPENGVHPQAVETVFQALSSVYDGQIMVATHSPVLVGLIETKQLLLFSKMPNGETDITTGDEHPRLANWKKDTPLARLYAAGILS